MLQFALAACQRLSCGGGKGALYRETLQATGFHVGRIGIATAELRRCHRDAFSEACGIYQSDGGC